MSGTDHVCETVTVKGVKIRDPSSKARIECFWETVMCQTNKNRPSTWPCPGEERTHDPLRLRWCPILRALWVCKGGYWHQQCKCMFSSDGTHWFDKNEIWEGRSEANEFGKCLERKRNSFSLDDKIQGAYPENYKDDPSSITTDRGSLQIRWERIGYMTIFAKWLYRMLNFGWGAEGSCLYWKGRYVW